jgi:hypothetical protein
MSLSLSLHSTEFFAVAGAEFLNFCFQILTSTRTQKPKEKTEKKKNFPVKMSKPIKEKWGPQFYKVCV